MEAHSSVSRGMLTQRPLLSSATIYKIHELGTNARFDTKRSALLSGLPPEFVAEMETSPVGSVQLLLDLRFMNDRVVAADGRVLLLEWLWTAQQLSTDSQLRRQAFRAFADEVVRGRLPAEARNHDLVLAVARELHIASEQIGLGEAAAVAVGLNAAIAAFDEDGKRAASFAADPLRQADQDISRLTQYKALHDALHGLPQRFRAIGAAIEALPGGASAAPREGDLRKMAAQILRDVVSPARTVSASLPEEERDRERAWIVELEVACTALAEANDPEEARSALDEIGRLQRTTSPRIDGILAEIADRMPLRALRLALSQIAAALTVVGQDTAAAELRSTYGPLGNLAVRLQRLPPAHKRWQSIEVDLSGTERLWGTRAAATARMRKKIRDALLPLLADGERDGEEWAKEATAALDDWEAAEIESDTEAARATFDRLCIVCRARFIEVDKLLLTLCGELGVITRPLRALLEIVAS
jgi:hypothetical protein